MFSSSTGAAATDILAEINVLSWGLSQHIKLHLNLTKSNECAFVLVKIRVYSNFVHDAAFGETLELAYFIASPKCEATSLFTASNGNACS